MARRAALAGKQPDNTREVPLPAPRFAVLWASLAYAACTLSLCYPALAGRFAVGPHSDQYIAGYAFREFGAATLRATGHFPQWNPFIFGGMPYIAAMHGDIFYPTFLLRMIMPTDAAMTWGFAIHLFLAGLFAYGFFRVIGYGFFGSLIGGIAYMMGGQLASLVSPGHDGKLFVSALFPLALWMLYLGIRRNRLWSWGVLALAVGLAVLSPHPQLLQYMLLTCGAYALYLAFSAADGAKLERRGALVRLGFALVSVLIGLAMGAIQYLPVRGYVPWSPRAGGLPGYAAATSYAWPPEELINTYLPQFSGIQDAYWGRNVIHLHSEYVGVVILLLAGAAFIRLRSDKNRGHLYFWIAALVIALLWSLGSATPFYHIPYALIPGTKYFRAPATIFFVGAFAISLLACVGTERLLNRVAGKKYFIGWAAVAFAVALLASVGGITSFAQSLVGDQDYEAVAANAGAVIAGAWRSFAFVALAAALALAYLYRRIGRRPVAAGLAFLAAVDLWTIMRYYWIFSAPAAQLFASDALIARIKSEPQPTRVLAALASRIATPDPFLGGDALMSNGIRVVKGYHGNELGRYDKLLGADSGWNQMLNPNVWKILNVKYLLTNASDLPLPRLGGPVRNAAGDDTYLFRLAETSPYAWVVPVIVKAADDPVLATVLNNRFDPARAALFDTSAAVQGAAGVTQLPEPLTVKANVVHYAAGDVSLQLDAPAPAGSALMVSENYYPGWSAKVDGRDVRTGRADFVLIGVPLPAGARNITLHFEDPSYAAGKAITLAAIAAALAVLLAGVLLERRRLV